MGEMYLVLDAQGNLVAESAQVEDAVYRMRLLAPRGEHRVIRASDGVMLAFTTLTWTHRNELRRQRELA